MSIDGSISASALFHDKDGTTTMKVVSLESVESYSDGLVASFTGTCGTSATQIDFSQYTKANGGQLTSTSFATITRLAFSASPAGVMETAGNIPEMKVGSKLGSVAVAENPGWGGFTPVSSPVVSARSISGTATYTVVCYGTEAT